MLVVKTLSFFWMIKCAGASTKFIKDKLDYTEINAAENYFHSFRETIKGHIQIPFRHTNLALMNACETGPILVNFPPYYRPFAMVKCMSTLTRKITTVYAYR